MPAIHKIRKKINIVTVSSFHEENAKEEEKRRRVIIAALRGIERFVPTVPSMRFTHRPLPQRIQYMSLHLLNVAIKLLVLLRVTSFPASIIPQPEADDDDGQGYGDDEVDPEPVGDDRVGARLEVEKGHAEDGGEVRAGEEEGAHEGDCLHGGAVALACVCDAALLSGDFEVESRFSLRDDVVQLVEEKKRK